jgi:hypothetical protein
MPRSSKQSLAFRFSIKALYPLLFSPMHTTCPIHLIFPYLIMQIIFHKEYKLWSSSQFSPASWNFLPVVSKYSPQHPVLKHPQSMFLP